MEFFINSKNTFTGNEIINYNVNFNDISIK